VDCGTQSRRGQYREETVLIKRKWLDIPVQGVSSHFNGRGRCRIEN
jgi:hypothetical protein